MTTRESSTSKKPRSATPPTVEKPPADAADAQRVAGGGDPSKDAGDPSATGAAPAEQSPPDVDDDLPKRDAPVRNAFVQPAQYDAPEGWKVGQRAPSDKFRAIDTGTGQPTGKATSKLKPGTYGTQVAVKGDTVTQAMLDSINDGE